MGATIVEKHVGKKTNKYDLNAYSCTAEQMEVVIDEIQFFETAFAGDFSESEALKKLKRGVYVNRLIKKGEIITPNDVYYAMPLEEGALHAGNYYDLIGKEAMCEIMPNDPIFLNNISDERKKSILKNIISEYNNILEQANITVIDKDDVELSAHYGLENFRETGALIISKINRSYCKKIIAMLPNQSHPTHRHLQKEECFELLKGDCILNLNGRDIELKKGTPILINRKVRHSFKTKNGCVIEEVSTTHIKGDSIYEDPSISKLTVDERKIKINL